MKSNSRKHVKLAAINYKGGACFICGYNKSISCLTFHHLDIKEKKFNIGQKLSVPWAVLKKELDKTILLCCNCHAEVHEDKDLYDKLRSIYLGHTQL